LDCKIVNFSLDYPHIRFNVYTLLQVLGHTRANASSNHLNAQRYIQCHCLASSPPLFPTCEAEPKRNPLFHPTFSLIKPASKIRKQVAECSHNKTAEEIAGKVSDFCRTPSCSGPEAFRACHGRSIVVRRDKMGARKQIPAFESLVETCY
jgi:hypothetical protein